MRATQIGTLVLVGLAVVGLAFVGPVAAHGDGPTTVNESTTNETNWNGSTTDWNESSVPPWMADGTSQEHYDWMASHMSDDEIAWMASHMTEDQYEWMASHMTEDQYEWMASHMGLTGDQWATDRPNATHESGPVTDTGSYGGGMGGMGDGWFADDHSQSSGQWSANQQQGTWGGQSGHGC